ncbi:hypothetical protein Tco_0630048 [Tanacetum coccineum]
MMTKSKICYDHSTKQAIGFEKPFYLKKARESKPKLYDGNTILKMDTIVIPDSDETLMLCEESLEVPKELPKVSMVNTSLKELKRHLTGFDQVVKERTTATAITEGTWGFEHTKACFRDEIIPFLKDLKESSNKLQPIRGVRLSTSASGSQPSGNTRNDRILQTPSSNSKNKVEAHPRNVKSSLNKRNGTVKVNGSAVVQNLKKQDNSDSNTSKKEYLETTGKVFTQIGYIWKPTGRTFTIVGNACPLTRITTTNEVPSRKPIALESESTKPVVKLVSKSSTGITGLRLFRTHDRRSLSAHQFHRKFLGTVKFGNDQVAKIMEFLEIIRLGMLLFQGFITLKDGLHL